MTLELNQTTIYHRYSFEPTSPVEEFVAGTMGREFRRFMQNPNYTSRVMSVFADKLARSYDKSAAVVIARHEEESTYVIRLAVSWRWCGEPAQIIEEGHIAPPESNLTRIIVDQEYLLADEFLANLLIMLPEK